MQKVSYINKITHKLFGKFTLFERTENYIETSRENEDTEIYKVSKDYFMDEFKID